MFYPRSDPLESYRPTLSARKYQIQKFHGCEILLPPNRKEGKTHLYDNRVCGTSVDTTASQHDIVALKDQIKHLQEHIKKRTEAYQANLEHHQVVIRRHESVMKEQAHIINALQTQTTELKSQNTSLRNQMEICVKSMPSGRKSGEGVKVSRFVIK
jgi:ribosomal protein S15P/S13E